MATLFRDPHRYDDLLHLPHPVPTTRLPMSRLHRAAQFAPFDALNGYGAAIRETARTTEAPIELDENAKHRLNRRLQLLLQQIEQPEITVTWFRPDDRKDGGAHIRTTGCLKKLDVFRNLLLLTDGTEIPIEDISQLDSDLFSCLDDLA